MKSAIIVGANGFIGQELTRYLLQRNIFVYALIQKGSDITFASPFIKNPIRNRITKQNRYRIWIETGFNLLYGMGWGGSRSKKRCGITGEKCNLYRRNTRFAHRHGVKKVVFPEVQPNMVVGES